ncbi:MAG: hypothetical protein L6R39_000363 [Caloplaca ligustica]|nr:MAG: hypothetical protein L6R39_000363 [Caloplaca ligustica]
MLSSYSLLGLAAVLLNFVAATPVKNGKEMRELGMGLAKRQDAGGEGLEREATTDSLGDAVYYTSILSAQAPVTYSTISAGAAPSGAVPVGTMTASLNSLDNTEQQRSRSSDSSA